jgi:hypothetical protein
MDLTPLDRHGEKPVIPEKENWDGSREETEGV